MSAEESSSVENPDAHDLSDGENVQRKEALEKTVFDSLDQIMGAFNRFHMEESAAQKAEILRLRDMNAGLQDTIAGLQDMIAGLQKDHTYHLLELRKEYQSNASDSNTEQHNAKLEAEVARLQAEIAKLQANFSSFQKQSNERYMNLKEKYTNAVSDLATVSAKRLEWVNSRDHYEVLSRKLECELLAQQAAHRDELDRLNAELITQRTTLQAESKTQHDALQAESKAQHAALQSVLSHTQQELAHCRRQMDTGVSKEITAMKASLETAKTENLGLRGELDELEKKLAVKEANTTMQRATSSARSKKKTIKSTPNPTQELTDDIEVLKTTSAELLQAIVTRRGELANIQHELSVSRECLKRYKGKEAEYLSKQAKLEEEKSNFEIARRKFVSNKMDPYEQGFADGSKKQRENCENLDRREEACSKLQEELNKKVDQVQENVNAMATEAYRKGYSECQKRMENELEKLKSELRSLENDVAQKAQENLMQTLVQQSNSIGRYRECDVYQNLYKGSAAQVDRLQIQVVNLKTELGMLGNISDHTERGRQEMLAALQLQTRRMYSVQSGAEFMSSQIRNTLNANAKSLKYLTSLGKLCEYLKGLSSKNVLVQEVVVDILFAVLTDNTMSKIENAFDYETAQTSDHADITSMLESVLEHVSSSSAIDANAQLQRVAKLDMLRKAVAEYPVAAHKFSGDKTDIMLLNALDFCLRAGLCCGISRTKP